MNLEMKSKIQNAFVLLALAGLMGLAVAVQAQTIQPIYSFTDGAYPYAALTLGPDGNFYGTTLEGGSNPLGTVFQVTTDGELTTLVNFVGANGATPQPSLTLGPDGNFYGTTAHGGSRDQGTVFRVTTDGALTTLVDFVGANGGYPLAALTLGPDGNFYGTTTSKGSFGEGTVFRVTTGGALTTLVSFDGYDKGAYPYAALTLGPDGNFYGTAQESGSGGGGEIYRLNLPPTISQIIHSADGGLTLDLVSTRNVSSRLYAATNLSPPFVWQPIATNLDGGAWRFTDTNTAGFPVKLYRVSTP